MIKIYAASGYENQFLVRAQLDLLQRVMGTSQVEFTGSWMDPPTFAPNATLDRRYPDLKPQKFKETLEGDFKEVEECDILLAFHPHFIGTMCEMSYAMGLKKPVIYCIDRKFMFDLDNCTDSSKFSKFFALANDMHPWEAYYSKEEKIDTSRWIVHTQQSLVRCLEHELIKLR